MTEEVAALMIRLEAPLARYEAQMRRATTTMHRAAGKIEKRAKGLDQRLSRVGEKFGIGFVSRTTIMAAALAAVGKVIGDIARNGDKFVKLESRFKALTGSAARGAAAFRNVLDIVEETGVSIDAAANSITRFTLASEAIGGTDDEVKKLTSTILKLGTIGGASQSELASGAMQLGQALASGTLQGDELRSILENMPLVARAIADGLGVGVGKLREMGAAGELTSRLVFDAILAKTDEVDEKFRKLPVTMDRAAGQLKGAWAKFTVELDKTLGLSESLRNSMLGIKSILDSFTPATFVEAAQSELSEAQERLSVMRAAKDSGGFAFGSQSDQAAQIAEAERRVADLQNTLRSLSHSDTPPEFKGIGAGQFVPLARPGIDLRDEKPFGETTASGGGSSPVDSAAIAMIEGIKQRVQALTEERGAMGLSGEELARYNAQIKRARVEQELATAASAENSTVTAAQAEEVRNLADMELILAENIAREREAMDSATEATERARAKQEELAQQLGDVAAGMVRAAGEAESFEDALKQIGVRLLEIAAQGALGQGPLGGVLGKFVSTALTGLVGVGVGSAVGGVGIGGSADFLGAAGAQGIYAKGGVFSGGRVTPFAQGGIVNGPTNFAMPNGLGLMGEAGPEAIMPLKRGPGGALGVQASGGGSSRIMVEMSPGLVASILAQAKDNSVQISQQSSRQAVQGLVDGHKDGRIFA